MHVHVCDGSEPEYTNGGKTLFWVPRLEKGGGQQVFSSFQGATVNI